MKKPSFWSIRFRMPGNSVRVMTSDFSTSGVSQQTSVCSRLGRQGFSQERIGVAFVELAEVLPRRDAKIVLRLNQQPRLIQTCAAIA